MTIRKAYAEMFSSKDQRSWIVCIINSHISKDGDFDESIRRFKNLYSQGNPQIKRIWIVGLDTDFLNENRRKKMKEIIFLYNDKRCHAKIVNKLAGNEKYICKMEVGKNTYEIYQLPLLLFDQFGFVAIKSE